MKHKIKQLYSILLNKHTNIFIALILLVLIIAAILLGGALMSLLGGGGVKGIGDAIYDAMLMIIDPGFLAVDAASGWGLFHCSSSSLV